MLRSTIIRYFFGPKAPPAQAAPAAPLKPFKPPKINTYNPDAIAYEPAIDALTKHYRKFHLEQPIVEFRKVVLPAKRLRTLDDTFPRMHAINEVAAVIQARDEFSDVDVVLDRYQISAMKRRVGSDLAPIYIRVSETEEDIRCILQKVFIHPTENFTFKVYLNRYIVGRPNLMFMPTRIDAGFKNPFSNKGGSYQSKVNGVWVWCYNEYYPSVLTINPQNIAPNRPYKIGDLQNLMPDGMILHEKYKTLMHRNMIEVAKDEQMKFMEQLDIKRQTEETQNKQQETAELIYDEGRIIPESKEVAERSKEKKKDSKTFSLKKRALKLNQDLKKEMDTMSPKKEGAK